MKCACTIPEDLAEAVQTAEKFLRAHKEAVWADLEQKVIEHLMNGTKLEDLEIIEHTKYKTKQTANYNCIVQKQRK